MENQQTQQTQLYSTASIVDSKKHSKNYFNQTKSYQPAAENYN